MAKWLGISTLAVVSCVLTGCLLVVDLPKVEDTDGGAAPKGTGGAGGSSDSGTGATGQTQSGNGNGSQASGGSSGSGGSGGGASGSSTACPKPCDCDDDGYRAEGGDCGGTDCNDNDPDVWPGQPDYFADPSTHDSPFDYNCDGKEEKRFNQTVDCSGAVGCDTASVGYIGAPPACGEDGNYGSCETLAAGLNCDFKGEPKTQVCQ